MKANWAGNENLLRNVFSFETHCEIFLRKKVLDFEPKRNGVLEI